VFWFIVSIILGLVAAAAALIGVGLKRAEESGAGAAITVSIVLFLVAGIILFLDSTTTVPTRTVAVETSFGKPVAVLDNGWHMIAPWASTEEFDATIQTLKLSGDQGDDQGTLVRLKNQTTARVDVTVQWRIETNADVLSLYQNYKSFENIHDNVVKRQLAAALNQVFEGFDPLAAIDDQGQQKTQLSDLATAALPRLKAAMPAGVSVLNLTLPSIRYDGNVQDNINKIINAAAATRQAKQQEQTAAAIKSANDALGGANLSAAVEYQNCLSMVERVIDAGKALPPAFSCGAPPTTVVPVK
jgi:regulator of protease activity HflC (stomatin/prohibitin superfamily)